MSTKTVQRKPRARSTKAKVSKSRAGWNWSWGGWLVAGGFAAAFAAPYVTTSALTDIRPAQWLASTVKQASDIRLALPNIPSASALRMTPPEKVTNSLPSPALPSSSAPPLPIDPARASRPLFVLPAALPAVRPPAPVPAPASPLAAPSRSREAARSAPVFKIADTSPLRAYPFTTADVLDTLPEDTAVQLLRGDGIWKRVKVSGSGKVGWIDGRYLESLGGSSPARAVAVGSVTRSSANTAPWYRDPAGSGPAPRPTGDLTAARFQ